MQPRPIRPAPPESAPTPIRRSWGEASGNGGGTNPPRDAAGELAVKVPILEAEIKGLRQLLAEVQANRETLRREIDALRRDRDHWQNLAKSAEAEKAEPRAWFCGRALPRK
jgi:FtsZ-binding cell division protein ZapB